MDRQECSCAARSEQLLPDALLACTSGSCCVDELGRRFILFPGDSSEQRPAPYLQDDQPRVILMAWNGHSARSCLHQASKRQGGHHLGNRVGGQDLVLMDTAGKFADLQPFLKLQGPALCRCSHDEPRVSMCFVRLPEPNQMLASFAHEQMPQPIECFNFAVLHHERDASITTSHRFDDSSEEAASGNRICLVCW